MLVSGGLTLLSSDRGLAPRARRDIVAAAAAGRFQIRDPDVALAIAGGALLGLGQLLHDQPERDDARTADDVTEDLLRLFGMSADDAHQLCQKPLPDIDELLSDAGSA